MKTILFAIAFAIATLFTTATNATVVGQQNMEGICLPLKNVVLLMMTIDPLSNGKHNDYEITLEDVSEPLRYSIGRIMQYTGKTADYVLNHLQDYAFQCVSLMKDGEDDSVTPDPDVAAPNPSIDENPPVVTYQQVQPTTPLQRFKTRAVTSASKAQCGTNPTLIANDGRQEIYQSRANNSGRTCTIVCTANSSQCAVTKQ